MSDDARAAAGTTDPWIDAQTRRLRLAVAEAELSQRLAEAQAATARAALPQLPDAQLRPLEGKVTLGDRVGLLAQTVAHALLGDGAEEIAQDVVAAKVAEGSRILIVEDRDLAAGDWQHAVVEAGLRGQRAAIEEAIGLFPQPAPHAAPPAGTPPAGARFIAPAVVAAAPQIVAAAADIVGMFRSDYAIAASDVSIGATPLVAAVAGRLHRLRRRIAVDGFQPLESALVKEFFDVQSRRAELERRAAGVRVGVDRADRRIGDLGAALSKAESARVGAATDRDARAGGDAALAAQIAELRGQVDAQEDAVADDRARLATAAATIARFDAFAAAVTTTPQGASVPPLVAAALRAPLHGEDRAVRYVLFVSLEAAGGETITRTSRFGRSGEIGVLGGANVSWLLLDVAQGTTISGGSRPLLGRVSYELDDDMWSQPRLRRIDLR